MTPKLMRARHAAKRAKELRRRRRRRWIPTRPADPITREPIGDYVRPADFLKKRGDALCAASRAGTSGSKPLSGWK
jgi:hypothetical protein